MFQSTSLAGLSGLVPGFHSATSDTAGFGDVLSMRGSANTLFFSPPAVALIVDDVPLGDPFSYPSALWDPAGLLVLRGPQGAAYGRNAAAGIIEMWSPRPGDSLAAGAVAEYGSYDSLGLRLHSAGPLGHGLSHTLQLYHASRDGFLSNPTLGRAPDHRSLTGGTVNLYWQPAPDTELRLRVLAERIDDGSQRLVPLTSPDRFTVFSEIPGGTDLDRRQFSFHATRDTEAGRFKSITAWQEWRLDPAVTDLDLMASPPGFGSSSTIIQEQQLFTQELRWESPDAAAPWRWRGGLFFMDKSTDGDATRAFPDEVAPGIFMPFTEQTIFALGERSAAAYARVGYAVDERQEWTAGMRLEFIDARIRRTRIEIYGATPPVHDDLDRWLVSLELGWNCQLADSLRLFARSAVGIKPPGFTAYAGTPATARFDEERAWTNELGVLVAVPEHHLELALTGFWNRIDDYQVNRSDTASNAFLILNAQRVTARGIEAALDWRPVDGLTLRGAFGHTHAEFDSYADPLVPGLRYDGNRVPFVPEFTGSIGARYDFAGGFYVQTSLRVTGATWFNESNQARYRQPAYAVWDAEAGYATDRFSVAVFGRNLLDKGYYTFMNPQIDAGAPGDPQLFGMRLKVEF